MGAFDQQAQGSPPLVATSIDALLSRITEGHKTILDVETNGKERTVAFSLQKLPPPAPDEPVRAETPSRRHDFYEAEGFAAYLARYGTKGDTVVYADPSSETAWATLREKAEDGVEVLTLRPQLHPLWRPWSEIVGRRLPLGAFRDHLNQYRRAVRNPDGRALALMLAQIRAAVEVTIHDGRGRNALNGIVVRSNVQGTDTREVVDLPEEITLHVPLYVGGEPQDVLLDLVLDAGADGVVTVMIAACGVQEARVLAFDNMLASIREGLKTLDATVCYGKPQHAPWAYLAPNKA